MDATKAKAALDLALAKRDKALEARAAFPASSPRGRMAQADILFWHSLARDLRELLKCEGVPVEH